MSKTKVTNISMVNALDTLAVLAGTRLPVKISYAVKKNIEIISRELKPYEEERTALINKHGDKDEEGNLKTDGNKCFIANVEEFNKEILELNEIENEVEFHNISLDDLLNSNAELSTRELTSIEFLLK